MTSSNQSNCVLVVCREHERHKKDKHKKRKSIVIGHYFHSYFSSIFDPTSLTFLINPFPLCLSFLCLFLLYLIHTSNPANTGKVVTPATRFTATLSYRVLVRMPNLPEKTLWRNTALARTYSEGNKTGNHRSQN